MFVAPAGTPTTLASIDQALTEYDPLRVHGYRLHYHRIKGIYDHLKALSLDERRRIPGLDAGREDIIVAGTAILLKVMDSLGIPSLTVSEGGLLEGVLARTYQKRTGVIPRIYL
jgi:exopolyphosphatase/guanosine-5'-triphosphate,3'-diphosphate pyrophosphatase